MFKNLKLKIKILGIFSIFVFSFLIFSGADAASLSLSPSSGTFNIGAQFSVSVYVSSASQSMNAASGVISFPQDKLEVLSLSKTGSIFALWVQEPLFSNSLGNIAFEGIVLNPGFIGASGKIVTINFKVKAAGNAALSFSSASVLANDGQGTNILSGLGSASFVLGEIIQAPSQPAPSAPEISGTPSAPQISSSTHPDSNKWYKLNDAKFSWPLPQGATAVRLLVGRIPDVTPTVLYTPAVNSKEVNDLADGVWYFHVQIKNSFGWGKVAHFKFQIDTLPPAPFTIKLVDGKETDNPTPTALFETTDSISGIDYYKIKVGDGEFYNLSKEELAKANPYTLPFQTPGKRTILVQAFDKAGNYTVATEEFVIKAINPPVLEEYPQQLKSGEVLTIKGKTYPDSQVIFWLQLDNEEAKSQSVKSDKGGNFVFVAEEKLKDGIWKIWAQALKENGAKSNPTDKITLEVEKSAVFKWGTWFLTFLIILIPAVALIALLGLLLWYSWYKITSLKKKVRKETYEAGENLRKAFSNLRKEIEKQVEMLDKKPGLSERERELKKKLKEALDRTESIAAKELKDIRKEVEDIARKAK